MAPTKLPTEPASFRLAIVCALPREADAVTLLFDELWTKTHDDGQGSDRNTYVTGRIGQHKVVLATLPGMGTINAARSTVKLTAKYTGLRLALLVGICGGSPVITNTNAFLGDVVMSKSILQYDFGRQYPYHFVIRRSVEDSLGRPNKEIRSLLAAFETELVDQRLKRAATGHLKHLQNIAKKDQRCANYQYPGAAKDKLYPSKYHHKHRRSCSECTNDSNAICNAATKSSCIELGCDPSQLVARRRTANPPAGADFVPQLFIGRVGSGNSVIKSALDRDRIAADHGIIAFEMEGAGVWDHTGKTSPLLQPLLLLKPSWSGMRWMSDASSAPISDFRGINKRSVAGNSAGGGAWVNQGDVTGNATSMPGPGQVPGEHDPRDPSCFPVKR
ncbi:hypothetical protein ACKLNR_004953 [Fusarium oxysporum f. sp. zingiberi]